LIYVVEAGRGFELGAVCVEIEDGSGEEMWMKNDHAPVSATG